MTADPGERWKAFIARDDSEDVPLWKALAQFTSGDLDEGLKTNAAVINRERPIFLRYYNIAFAVSLAFGFLLILFLPALLMSARTGSSNALSFLSLIALAGTIAPHLLRQIYQYGWKTPDTPLDLPHPADRRFDEFLSFLQRLSGPRAFYRTRFGKKRQYLSRRQFFGRLRYFLFSEHSTDRSMVIRFGTGLSVPADIFLAQGDVEKIIAMNTPKRRGGPGRKAKYRYDEAIIALIGDPRIATLEFSDSAATVRTIKNWLAEWFEANAGASGDVPRDDLLAPYARKIYDRLKADPSVRS